jgi:hypothetical protein
MSQRAGHDGHDGHDANDGSTGYGRSVPVLFVARNPGCIASAARTGS